AAIDSSATGSEVRPVVPHSQATGRGVVAGSAGPTPARSPEGAGPRGTRPGRLKSRSFAGGSSVPLESWDSTPSLQTGADRLQRLVERRGDLLGEFAAGLGEVGASAPAAADDRGDLLEPVARVQTGCDAGAR